MFLLTLFKASSENGLTQPPVKIAALKSSAVERRG